MENFIPLQVFLLFLVTVSILELIPAQRMLIFLIWVKISVSNNVLEKDFLVLRRFHLMKSALYCFD